MSSPNRNKAPGNTGPGPNACYQLMGISKETVRDSLKYSKTHSLSTCRHCGKNVEDIKKCAKCKVTFYCSKDCQRADWNRHKTSCANPDVPGPISDLRRLQKFNVSFRGIRQLTMSLDGYLASLFNLLSFLKEGKPLPELPLFAEIQITVIPSNPEDRIKLQSSSIKLDRNNPVPGSFYIIDIKPYEDANLNDISDWYAKRNASVAEQGPDSITISLRWRFREATIVSSHNVRREMLLGLLQREPGLQQYRQWLQTSPLGAMVSQLPWKNFYQLQTASDYQKAALRLMNSLILMDSRSSNIFRMQTSVTSDDAEDLRHLSSEDDWRRDIGLQEGLVDPLSLEQLPELSASFWDMLTSQSGR